MIQDSDIINGSLLSGGEINMEKFGYPLLIQKLPGTFDNYAKWKMDILTGPNITWIEKTAGYVRFLTKMVNDKDYADWYPAPARKKQIPVSMYDNLREETFAVLYMEKGYLYSDNSSYIDTDHLSKEEKLNLCDAIYQTFGFEPRIIGKYIGMGKLLTDAWAFKLSAVWPLCMSFKFPYKELVPGWTDVSGAAGF